MKPKKWQTNPNNVKTDKVQYWRNGIMFSLMAKDVAQSLVSQGKAFVITDQAIGELSYGKMNS